MRWLFPGKEVRIDARCLDCAEPLFVRFRDDAILEVQPATIVGHTVLPFSAREAASAAFR